MLRRFDNPIFMTNEEIDTTYEGMWALVKKRNEDDLMYDGGYVVATIEHSPDSRGILCDILEEELGFKGYIHYGYIDKGENIDVVFIASN